MAEEKKKKKEKKVYDESFKFRISRKTYWVFYLMVLIVVGYVLYLYFKGLEVNRYALILAGVFCILVFKFTELHRMSYFYKLTSNSLVCSFGLINKNIKNIDYLAISDINVLQPLIKRILNIGSLVVRSFSKDSTYIKNIPNPELFASRLSERISEKRKNSGSLNAQI